jgi:hypothetical protein
MEKVQEPYDPRDDRDGHDDHDEGIPKMDLHPSLVRLELELANQNRVQEQELANQELGKDVMGTTNFLRKVLVMVRVQAKMTIQEHLVLLPKKIQVLEQEPAKNRHLVLGQEKEHYILQEQAILQLLQGLEQGK